MGGVSLPAHPSRLRRRRNSRSKARSRILRRRHGSPPTAAQNRGARRAAPHRSRREIPTWTSRRTASQAHRILRLLGPGDGRPQRARERQRHQREAGGSVFAFLADGALWIFVRIELRAGLSVRYSLLSLFRSRLRAGSPGGARKPARPRSIGRESAGNPCGLLRPPLPEIENSIAARVEAER